MRTTCSLYTVIVDTACASGHLSSRARPIPSVSVSLGVSKSEGFRDVQLQRSSSRMCGDRAVTKPGGKHVTWAVSDITKTSILYLVEHVFDAAGSEVFSPGDYKIVALMTVPTASHTMSAAGSTMWAINCRTLATGRSGISGGPEQAPSQTRPATIPKSLIRISPPVLRERLHHTDASLCRTHEPILGHCPPALKFLPEWTDCQW